MHTLCINIHTLYIYIYIYICINYAYVCSIYVYAYFMYICINRLSYIDLCKLLCTYIYSHPICGALVHVHTGNTECVLKQFVVHCCSVTMSDRSRI